LSPNIADLPPRYLRTPEAARFVGLSIRTLEKHRIYGTGPRYSKLGGRVVYRVEDLQTWVASGAKASTSGPRDRDRAAGETPSAQHASAHRSGAPLRHVGAPSPPLGTRTA
jgi:predicted DNA-binding transcriptional regulator AlpA